MIEYGGSDYLDIEESKGNPRPVNRVPGARMFHGSAQPGLTSLKPAADTGKAVHGLSNPFRVYMSGNEADAANFAQIAAREAVNEDPRAYGMEDTYNGPLSGVQPTVYEVEPTGERRDSWESDTGFYTDPETHGVPTLEGAHFSARGAKVLNESQFMNMRGWAASPEMTSTTPVRQQGTFFRDRHTGGFLEHQSGDLPRPALGSQWEPRPKDGGGVQTQLDL